MNFHKITDRDLAWFETLLPGNCFAQLDVLSDYGHDETEDLHFLPEVVVKPGTVE